MQETKQTKTIYFAHVDTNGTIVITEKTYTLDPCHGASKGEWKRVVKRDDGTRYTHRLDEFFMRRAALSPDDAVASLGNKAAVKANEARKALKDAERIIEAIILDKERV